MKHALRRGGDQLLRAALLVAIIVASGVGLGFAAGYPVSRIEFEESDAVRLDHTRLAGEVDPAAALVTGADLPLTWVDGDAAFGAFGLLGLSFCGEEVDLPTALSAKEVAVFSSPADDAVLISEAVRVDRWQSARAYVDDVASSVHECDQFFRTGANGDRVRVEIRPGMGEPPITDHVARTFVAEDGSSVQVWALMSVGDVLIALQHIGPTRPQEGFLDDLQDKLLARIDPTDFAPRGIATEPEGDTDDPAGSGTTVPAGGAADETEAIPNDPADPGPAGGAADETGTGGP